MKSLRLTFGLLVSLIALSSKAQMYVSGDTLYGNEWINYDQDYFKIKVAEDGFFKITYQNLNDAGVFTGTNSPNGNHFQLFYMGNEVPIQVSTDGAFSTNDFIAFYGKKNRGELDQHLYIESNPTNPEYSLFSDTSAYFLTWNVNNTNTLRYTPIINNINNPPAAESYYFHEATTAYTSTYWPGRLGAGSGVSWSCAFDIAEGWAGPWNTSLSIPITTSNIYNGGPSSTLITRYRTKAGEHDIQVSINGTTLLDTTFFNDAVKQHLTTFNTSLLAGSNAVSVLSTASPTDQIAAAYCKLRYPRAFDFSNSSSFSFSIQPSNNSKYIEITNFNSGSLAPLVFDITNALVIESILENGIVKLLLPPSLLKRNLVVVSALGYKTISAINQSNFINYDAIQGEYIILSHASLRNNGAGVDYVQDYADYRSSPAGGNYEVLLANIQQVYDQFSYGINRHEISVRNFVHYAVKEWNSKYLFLLGKGVNYFAMRTNPTQWESFYKLPSFGTPQSDNLFAASNSSNLPIIPVGRLAASTPDHVDLYLRKVIDYESNLSLPQTIKDKAWMKRIIHLGGGDAPIQNFIRNELTEIEGIAHDGKFGANVFPFYKTSTDVIQEAPSEQIASLINDGVSMVTFFGHSAPSTLDFDLESPSSYSNSGRYPFVYTIGCHTSRMFEFNGTLSEQWVLAEDKGAIAFLGATWETTLSNLSTFAKVFYQNMMEDNYGEPIGDILKATIEDFDLNSSFFAEQLKQVMLLHGDPALRLNAHQGPDYIINPASVSTNPALVSAQMDSFQLNLNAINIGSAVPDSFLITVEHELPNGTIRPSTQYNTKSPGFKGIYQLSIPMPDKDILGFNKLKITVDSRDSIAELPNPMAEMNNSYDHIFYIVANDAFPTYPYEYSIVTAPNVTLKASTANAFAEKQKYYMQIDTTNYFNSPQKRETIVEQIGGVVSWAPPISYSNNTVYYWRISIDSTLTTGLGFNWHESSFLYKENSSQGWNQSHFHQLRDKNQLTALKLEEPGRKLRFSEPINELKIKTGPWPIAGDDQMSAIVNGGVMQIYKSCMPDGLHVVVLDPITLTPWVNPPGGAYNSPNCLTYNFYSFPYATNTVETRANLIDFLENIIPANYIVAVYSIQKTLTSTYYDDSWALDSINNSFQKNIFQVLEEQGATKIRQLENLGSVPYLFLYQKDNPAFLAEQNYMTEVIADTVATIIETTNFFSIPNDKGSVSSTKVGPALSWQSLQWNIQNYEPATDAVQLKIYGIDNQNNSFLLHNNITVTDTSLTHINALQYPYLQLEFNIKDSIERTSPNLNYWRVLYDPAPDAALRPDLNFAFYADTIQQGETLTLDIAVENITAVDMDSLLVHYTVIDQNNTAALTGQRMAPLTRGATLTAHLDFNTKNITTPFNQLLVEVNPNDDQPEQHHFNNVGILPFYLLRDNRNPLLDVTFDGIHILDGDIVSAKPIINIALLDDNPYLPLDDTSLFRIKILYPEETIARTISKADTEVTFIPAEDGNLSKNNKARIEIRKSFETDGIYELFVEAKDATGNSAGTYDYRTRFEVINKEMISNVFNYPNPFSTQTQFVFTLTGSEVPDFMKIQIMSVSGKVIREITQDELGPLHVGKNMTSYRWDGTDEYGDRLGNGVYLYRVVTRKTDGAMYDDFDTKTDQYFKNGIGKMVIIR